MANLTGTQVEQLKQAADAGLLGDFLSNRGVCFTGTLSMRREDLVQLLHAVGGVWHERMTYYTAFLVVGNTGRHGETRKIKDARRRGVNVITEDEFVEYLVKKR